MKVIHFSKLIFIFSFFLLLMSCESINFLKKQNKINIEGLFVSTQTSVQFKILNIPKSNQISLEAYDAYDKEKIEVENLDWNGKKLSFQLFTPSTKYKIGVVLLANPSGDVLDGIITTDKNEKIPISYTKKAQN